MDSLLSRVAERLARRDDGSGPTRGARRGRLLSTFLLAWLVLMTIWGFGRAADSARAGLWLAGGLVAAGVTIVIRSRPPNDR